MSITLKDKTKLTSKIEKLFIEAGGTDPNKTFSQTELSLALKKTITILAERKSPILKKIYKQAQIKGDVDDIDPDELE